MKKPSLIALALAVALAGVPITSGLPLAEDGHPGRGAIIVALSTSGNFCGWISEAGSISSSALACKPSGHVTSGNLIAAVSCGSDQWCCKHDIGGSGACTKCCSK